MTMKPDPLLKRAKSAWQTMHRRCKEATHRDFPRYGGRGIRVCPQWTTFEQFLRDMGLPPSPTHWLGRRDTSAHFTPDNCLWTTHDEQMARRQFCRKVIVEGKTLTAAEAARLAGQPSRNTVLRRWEAGFSLENPKLAKLYRRSMWITHKGETLPLPEWARRLGLSSSVLWQRIKSGMPLDRAMTPKRLSRTPIQQKP